jgi:lipopolysaccharide biosynthesis protein
MKRIRTIAIYLPQFHRTSENDKHWGHGFTEWTNVTKAKPRFRGHYEPHLPSDLGFYDLRVPEIREEQAELAKQYGIYGFCYYHYWFNGKRMLECPFEEVLATGKPDFPFMLCWANGDWNKAWIGKDEVIVEQEYSEKDDLNHICYLLNVFKDSRYIRVDNKPVIAIYRSFLFPNIRRTIQIWREEARKEGLELYICRMESLGSEGEIYLRDGFDAAIEFQPHNLGQFAAKKRHIINILNSKVQAWFNVKLNIPTILSYKKYVEYQIKRLLPSYPYYPSVTPMWDNSPRKVNLSFFAFKGSTPELYQKWLKSVMTKFKPYSKDENLIFINAWNEWAEGNHLEPDQKWGRGYLDATKNALEANIIEN